MRTIIAGSRGCNSMADVEAALAACGWMPSVVISGTARGADQLGEEWARLNGIEVVRFPAEWARYGRSAGYRRNQEMAEHADALVALWDGESRGTGHMIDIAKAKGLRVYIHRIG